MVYKSCSSLYLTSLNGLLFTSLSGLLVLKRHFDETLGANFFYFLKLRLLKYIPVEYQDKILSRKLSKLRSKILILRPPLI